MMTMNRLFLISVLLHNAASSLSVSSQPSPSTTTPKNSWVADEWGECVSTGCGVSGMQMRKVTCQDSLSTLPRDQSKCSLRTKPVEQRTCFKVCEVSQPQYHWIVGEWDECVDLTTTARNEANVTLQQSKCGNDADFLGVQNRTVACVCRQNSSSIADDLICIKTNPRPISSRPCQVPCPVDCVTSVFSPWSNCSSNCGDGLETRGRRVIREQRYGGRPCGPLVEFRPCTASTTRSSCPLDGMVARGKYWLKLGKWTACRASTMRGADDDEPKKRRNNRRRTPRSRRSHGDVRATSKPIGFASEQLVGERRRQVDCTVDVSTTGASQGSSNSETGTLVVVETCAVPRRCQVTPWTAWSACKADCFKSGVQIRKRYITSLAISDLRPCPPLKEIRSCMISFAQQQRCLRYEWMSGDWSDCQFSREDSRCGGGEQWRHVFCIQRTKQKLQDDSVMDASDYTIQLESQCDQKNKPEKWRQCNVPCRPKCVLGQWTEWSECAPARWCSYSQRPSSATVYQSTSNKAQGYARRTRSVQVDWGSPEDCDHGIETVPCPNPNCFFWRPTNVSECKPENRRTGCGPGHIDQSLECRGAMRRPLTDDQCKHRAQLSSRLYSCTKSCSDDDCTVSQWGSWSPCPISCGNSKKVRSQNRTRTVMSYGRDGGRSCDQTLIESRECSYYRCSSFHWKTSSWSECVANTQNINSQQLVDETGSIRKRMREGSQTRAVYCNKIRHGKVRNKNCIGQKRPSPARVCELPLGQDCVLSGWSPWSPCPDPCSDLKKFQENYKQLNLSVIQTRNRFVVKHASGRGLLCSSKLTETRECRTTASSQECPLYRWITGNWSECMVSEGVTPIRGKCKGIQKRFIRCRYTTEENPSLLYAVQELSPCLENAGMHPQFVRSCLINCAQKKSGNSFQDENLCSLEDLPTKDDLIGNRQNLNLISSVGNATSAIQVVPFSNWSSCIMETNESQLSCGKGKQYRALSCLHTSTGLRVSATDCNRDEDNFQVRDCVLSCPTDCVMSEWSTWGECGQLLERSMVDDTKVSSTSRNNVCGSNLRMRYRYIVTQSRNGGRPCPDVDRQNKVYQFDSCSRDCRNYFWYASAWTICKSVDRSVSEQSCNKGVQRRTVNCYSSKFTERYPNYANREISKYRCDVKTEPPASRPCTVSCPGHCVLSDWSSWGECFFPNQTRSSGVSGSCEGSKRSRTRAILREHNDGILTQESPLTGRRPRYRKGICPAPSKLKQTEKCQLNDNCYTYSVQWTAWSSCLLQRDADCGGGSRQRSANCARSDGTIVSPTHCKRRWIKIPQAQISTCFVKCPIDCVMTDWSQWGNCSSVCGSSRARIRTRKVLREGVDGGRSCNEKIKSQTLPCEAVSCFSWKLTEWSSCHVTGNKICGSGIQTRSLKCFQQDGTEVEDTYCKKQSSIKQMQLSSGQQFDKNEMTLGQENLRLCYLPCPGECQMSSWSTWSKCQQDCDEDVDQDKSVIRIGYQSRSRIAVVVGKVFNDACPRHHINTRKCKSTTCYSYKWMTGSFASNNRRDVWCQRSPDGLHVTSGCDMNTKPSETRPEEQGCSNVTCSMIKNAICHLSSNKCACKKNFQPKFDSAQEGKLLKCINYPSLNDEGFFVKHLPTNRKVESSTQNVDNNIILHRVPNIKDETDIEDINLSTNEDVWALPNPITPEGKLKVWAYGAIAGFVVLLVLLFAVTYLTISTCRRARRRNKSQTTTTRPYTYPRYSSAVQGRTGPGAYIPGNGRMSADSSLGSVRKSKQRKKSGGGGGGGNTLNLHHMIGGRSSAGGTLFGDTSNGIPPYYSARTSSIGRNLYPPFPRPLTRTPSTRSDFSMNDVYNGYTD